MLNKSLFIFVTGHRGLVGSSLLRRLKFYGYKNIIVKTKKELDLRNQNKVLNFFKKNKIDAIINAAGKVGGILANNRYKAVVSSGGSYSTLIGWGVGAGLKPSCPGFRVFYRLPSTSSSLPNTVVTSPVPPSVVSSRTSVRVLSL